MGADGHVKIYDFGKLVEKFGENKTKDFLSNFLSSKMYRQTLNDKEYLTRYFGDNLWSNDLYENVIESYSPDTDSFNKNSYNYCKYDEDFFMGLNVDQRKTFYSMISYLENSCALTTWEVWT